MSAPEARKISKTALTCRLAVYFRQTQILQDDTQQDDSKTMLQNKHIITVGRESEPFMWRTLCPASGGWVTLLSPSKEQKTQPSAFGFKGAPQPLHS
jgi:hypothetical protein